MQAEVEVEGGWAVLHLPGLKFKTDVRALELFQAIVSGIPFRAADLKIKITLNEAVKMINELVEHGVLKKCRDCC